MSSSARLPIAYLRDCKATSAVEFALLAPVTLFLLLGIIAFSVTLSTYSALQQIAAEAARAGLPGLSGTQQAQLANQYVSGVLASYGFIDPSKVSVSTTATASTFAVSLSYDASKSFFGSLSGMGAIAPMLITRSAVVQLSGF